MFLDSKGIKVEKVTFNTLLFLVTIAVTDTKAGTLLAVLNNYKGEEKCSKYKLPESLPQNNEQLPRDEFYKGCKEGHSEWIEYTKAVSRVSSNMVVPYPPGLPILLPGEIVSQDIIDYIDMLKESEIHGLKSDKKIKKIWVLR